jgi:hypothetical protein
MPTGTALPDTLAHDAHVVAPFVRGTTTWLALFACFYLLSIQSGPGPAMPYIRSERGMTYTVAGLHSR